LNVRTLGSPALSLCYVAAGRMHAYYGLDHLNLWDIAAGAVIVKEAGGAFTTLDGRPWREANDDGYLATNGAAHTHMKGYLASVRKLQREVRARRG
ncbi:MAG TPA: inositol monophosphatase family protein, partial [Anaerolineae bacterium]